ncbi:hypothetical protein ACFLUO_07230 [Chloroflexota bacterium]
MIAEKIGEEELVCHAENENWRWMDTFTEPYVKSILGYISQKMLGNEIGDCQLTYELSQYIGPQEDGETGWVEKIPEDADPNEYTEIWGLHLNGKCIGDSDDKDGAQELFGLAIDNYLNLEETANLIELFKQLRTLDTDIHISLQEALVKRKYCSCDCGLCQRQSV